MAKIDPIAVKLENIMNEREKIVKNYIDGYNQFNCDKMLMDFDENVVFENIQEGEVSSF